MRPYQNYQRVSVQTADPVRIIVMLYEGAIKNLNQAMLLFGKDNDAASARIVKTLDIINYLRNALDHEKGGEIAFNLERLYEYMRDTLTQANINRDTEKIQVTIGLLQTLLEGWRGIVASGTTAVDGDISQPATPALAATQTHGLSMMG